MKLPLKQKKYKIFITSIFWNTVIKIMKQKKDIDISPYLVSIKVLSNRVIITTNSSVVSRELVLYESEISAAVAKICTQLGVPYQIEKIIYR